MPSGEPIEKWVSLAARGLMGAAQKVGQSKAVQAAAGAQAIRTLPGMVADKFGWGTDEEDAMRERTTAEHEEARARQQQKTQANVNTGGIHNAPQTPSTSSVMGVGVGKGGPMDLAFRLLKRQTELGEFNPDLPSSHGPVTAWRAQPYHGPLRRDVEPRKVPDWMREDWHEGGDLPDAVSWMFHREPESTLSHDDGFWRARRLAQERSQGAAHWNYDNPEDRFYEVVGIRGQPSVDYNDPNYGVDERRRARAFATTQTIPAAATVGPVSFGDHRAIYDFGALRPAHEFDPTGTAPSPVFVDARGDM